MLLDPHTATGREAPRALALLNPLMGAAVNGRTELWQPSPGLALQDMVPEMKALVLALLAASLSRRSTMLAKPRIQIRFYYCRRNNCVCGPIQNSSLAPLGQCDPEHVCMARQV